jgi:hypothetical protein
MNYAFDTGLTQKWEFLYLTELFGSRSGSLKSLEVDENVHYMITFEILYGFFRIIIKFYLFCIFIFLCEIFWHGFLRNLSWSLILRTFKFKCCAILNSSQILKKIHRKIYFWKQRRTLKVRKIQVRPINV